MFEISILTRTLGAPDKLPAGAGKIPPVACEKRRQPLCAQKFASIRR